MAQVEIHHTDALDFKSNKTKLKKNGDIKPLYPFVFYPGKTISETPRDPLLLTKNQLSPTICENPQSSSSSSGSKSGGSWLSFLNPRSNSKMSKKTKTKAKSSSTSMFSSKTSKAGNALIVLMSTYPTALAITRNLRRDDILSIFNALQPHLILSLRGKPQFNRWLHTMVRNTSECSSCGLAADEFTALEKMREYRIKGWYKGAHTCVGCGDIVCTPCATFFAHSEYWKDKMPFRSKTYDVNGFKYRKIGGEETINYVRSFCGCCARNPIKYGVGFGHEAKPNLKVVNVKTGRETSSDVAVRDNESDGEGKKKMELDRRTVMVEECNVVPYGFYKLSTTPCWMIAPGGTVLEGQDLGWGHVVIRTRYEG